MAKHNIILIASLLALALFIAHTNASRHEEEQSCRQQLEKLNLKHCEKHIMKRIQRDEDEDEDENVLKMRGINYIRNRSEEDLKEECCNQLSEIRNMDCRCHALQEIMDNLGERVRKNERDDVESELRRLPMRCGMEPPSRCDLSFDN